MGYFEYTDEMYKESRFAVEDEPKLVKTIESVVALAEQAKREGLLGVEYKIENIEGDFYKSTLQMVVDGLDVNLQFDYGKNIIREVRNDAAELRNMMLWNKGMAMLSRGEHPLTINKILNSMIGKYSFEKEVFSNYNKSW